MSDSIVRRTRKQVEHYLEILIRHIFFWETDDKRLGILLRTLHQFCAYSILISYIFLHSLFPSYFALLLLWLIVSVVLCLQILFGGCVCTRIEQRLAGDRLTIIDPILHIFNIPNTRENSLGITILLTSIFFFCLTSELFCRAFINVKSVFSFFRI